jgi:hypothetical protein
MGYCNCRSKFGPIFIFGLVLIFLQILAPISLSIDNGSSALRAQAKKLLLSTTDSKERVPASVGVVENSSILWKVDRLRLPVYNRYSSSLAFEIGGSSGIVGGRHPEALAVLWLKDLVDNEETDIDLPVVMGRNLKHLRQNVLNDFTASTHSYKVIGHIKTRVKLDSGLDEVCVKLLLLLSP